MFLTTTVPLQLLSDNMDQLEWLADRSSRSMQAKYFIVRSFRDRWGTTRRVRQVVRESPVTILLSNNVSLILLKGLACQGKATVAA